MRTLLCEGKAALSQDVAADRSVRQGGPESRGGRPDYRRAIRIDRWAGRAKNGRNGRGASTMNGTKTLFALAIGTLPALCGAADYLGMLKAPQSGFVPSGLYSFANIPLQTGSGAMLAEPTTRLKLGYKYSRYLAVESEFVDGTRAASDLFAAPGNLTSAFRSASYGVDTIATLPVWRFSFYGRMGAYRGDPRSTFASYSTSLLADNSMRSRWRYGLGMRYDITKALGVRAEMEHYSLMGGSSLSEPESDQISLGVSWRF